jgi:hypothetical protein
VIAPPGMIATVLLYSGIENPHWVVPPERAVEVANAIEAMPELDRPCPPPGGLGYTGVSITFTAPDGGVHTWTFGNGIAESDQRCFADAGRRIERMVLESGRGHFDASLLPDVLREGS